MASVLIVGAHPCDVRALKRFYGCGDFRSVIAVDGGYETLRAASIGPTVAIGDFDSLGFVPDDVPTERFSPIKDKSDMELVFDWLGDDRGADCFIFGALGGRLDHTLANLQLFARESEAGRRVIAVGEGQAAAFLTGPDAFHLPAADAGVVSVFAMNDRAGGVTEEGLFYPLRDATLSNRTSLGLSNELTGEPVMISVTRGTIVILYPVELLIGR